MGGAVGRNVETAATLRVQLLGPFSIRLDGATVPLPRSRKVRALLAFLALGTTPYSRSRLCALLWDVPNDPRGELRWCLSKLRTLLDDPDRRRVQTTGHGPVSLDLSDCLVDAVEIERVVKAGAGRATTERLSEVCDLFGGDLLEGVEIDGNPEFAGWLIAQRQRYREMNLVASSRTRVAPATRERGDLPASGPVARACPVRPRGARGDGRRAPRLRARAGRRAARGGRNPRVRARRARLVSPSRLLAERKSAAGSARADASAATARPSTHPRQRRRSRGDAPRSPSCLSQRSRRATGAAGWATA